MKNVKIAGLSVKDFTIFLLGAFILCFIVIFISSYIAKFLNDFCYFLNH